MNIFLNINIFNSDFLDTGAGVSQPPVPWTVAGLPEVNLSAIFPCTEFSSGKTISKDLVSIHRRFVDEVKRRIEADPGPGVRYYNYTNENHTS